jgi:signal peptidase II
MHNGVRLILFAFLIVSFIGCDRITKNMAKEHLENRAPVSYLHGTIRLSYAENSGAGMSVGELWPPRVKLLVLKVIPTVTLLVVLIYTIWNSQKIRSMPMFAISLIISGGIGNLIDRVFYHNNVIDFLNIGVQNIQTGIFNIADVCITFGAILLAFLYMFRKKYVST